MEPMIAFQLGLSIGLSIGVIAFKLAERRADRLIGRWKRQQDRRPSALPAPRASLETVDIAREWAVDAFIDRLDRLDAFSDADEFSADAGHYRRKH